MKLIVDISDRLIKKVKDHYVNPYEVDEICEAILEGTPIPDIDADKKPGKWEPRSIDGPGRSLMVYKCSECKKFALYMTDYCPGCGAKMEWRRQNDKFKH